MMPGESVEINLVYAMPDNMSRIESHYTRDTLRSRRCVLNSAISLSARCDKSSIVDSGDSTWIGTLFSNSEN